MSLLRFGFCSYALSAYLILSKALTLFLLSNVVTHPILLFHTFLLHDEVVPRLSYFEQLKNAKEKDFCPENQLFRKNRDEVGF